MYEIRQIIARLWLGESDRDIARTQAVGRKTVAAVRGKRRISAGAGHESRGVGHAARLAAGAGVLHAVRETKSFGQITHNLLSCQPIRHAKNSRAQTHRTQTLIQINEWKIRYETVK